MCIVHSGAICTGTGGKGFQVLFVRELGSANSPLVTWPECLSSCALLHVVRNKVCVANYIGEIDIANSNKDISTVTRCSLFMQNC